MHLRSIIHRLVLWIVAMTAAVHTGAIARGEMEQPLTLPKSAAAEQLAAWLEVVNSGDPQRIGDFALKHHPAFQKDAKALQAFVDRGLAAFRENGAVDIRQVAESKLNSIKVFVQARQTGYWFEAGIAVSPEDPSQITGNFWRPIETPVALMPADKLSEQEVSQRCDALVDVLAKANFFSGAILIAKDGKPIYKRAAGLANVAWNTPNQIDTKFNLASIGKMFTAVAVAQLVEQGKLHYDDTVGSILPDWPNKDVREKVRISHLLSHTSGLPTMGSDLDASFSLRARSPKDYLPGFQNVAPAFEPGSKFLYSNCGYDLLGVIIEKASGETFAEYLRKHVFKPAGMNDTDNYDLEKEPRNLASGYRDASSENSAGDGLGVRLNNMFKLTIVGEYSTVGDMLKFGNALQDHTLVSEDTLKNMWAGKINNGRGGRYGYGCHITRYNGTRVVWHGGGSPGVTNRFEIYPDLGYIVVILNNIDCNPEGMSRKIREWLTQGTHQAEQRTP